MARTPRVTPTGALHHVISRFVDREWFLTSDNERRYYLQLLARALRQTDWRCVAYCLMSNHLHFAMIAGEKNLESWAKKVNSPFAQWLNAQHNRIGPVFADRPTSRVVPPEREGFVIAYIQVSPAMESDRKERTRWAAVTLPAHAPIPIAEDVEWYERRWWATVVGDGEWREPGTHEVAPST